MTYIQKNNWQETCFCRNYISLLIISKTVSLICHRATTGGRLKRIETIEQNANLYRLRSKESQIFSKIKEKWFLTQFKIVWNKICKFVKRLLRLKGNIRSVKFWIVWKTIELISELISFVHITFRYHLHLHTLYLPRTCAKCGLLDSMRAGTGRKRAESSLSKFDER